MRLLIVLLFTTFFFSPLSGKGQAELGAELAALNTRYKNKDTSHINARNAILEKYASEYPDSVLAAGKNTIKLARRMKYPAGEVQALLIDGIAYSNKRAYPEALETLEQAYQISEKKSGGFRNYRILNVLGSVHIELGNYSMAFEKFFAGLKLAEAANDEVIVAALLNNIANSYFFQNNYEEAEKYYQKTLDIGINKKDTSVIAISYNNFGELYLTQKKFEKARFFLEKSGELGSALRNVELRLASQILMAKTYTGLDSLDKANAIYKNALDDARNYGDGVYQTFALLGLASNYSISSRNEEALQLAKDGITIAEKIGQRNLVRDGHELLAVIQAARGNGLEAFHHHKLFKLYADSLNNLETERSAALQLASYEYSKKELLFERKSLQQKWFIFSAIAGLITIAIIAFLINTNRSRLSRANHELNATNQKIELQKSELEDTLNKLTTTQAQLIQAEKMASLGELTAGIAHEIQNPLNFVNNFSEVSKELLNEMKEELAAGHLQLANEIASDVEQNLDKIHHHGKRADAIVKGMLQHSRTRSGQKEPTNINALCDEYLRLSYNGIRAKNQSFNASFHFEPDLHLPMINVVPQDIGRVLLNLINNAFQACGNDEFRMRNAELMPHVKVSTKNQGDKIEISVKDNGPGIPDAIKDKIFQPFFTTKPTGQGTGLGLSLSYDIVKAHGGEIKVETKEGEGSEFVVVLPRD